MSAMREAFDSWMDHDDWKFADREAAWKWMYDAGYQAAIADVKVVGEVGSVQGQTAYVFATSDALFKVGDKLYKLPDGEAGSEGGNR